MICTIKFVMQRRRNELKVGEGEEHASALGATYVGDPRVSFFGNFEK